MTKTKNYNLNQWEPADPIRRTDFNADNAAIDAALAGNARALSDYKTANDAAVAKKADKTALAALEQSVDNADSALETAIASAEVRVTALERGVALTCLAAVVTTDAGQAVTVDLSDADMSSYSALLVFLGAPQMNSSTAKITLRVNGTNMMTLKNYSKDCGTVMAWVVPVGNTIMGGGATTSSTSSVGSSCSGELDVAWSDIQNVGISGSYPAGLSCGIYAFKAA